MYNKKVMICAAALNMMMLAAPITNNIVVKADTSDKTETGDFGELQKKADAFKNETNYDENRDTGDTISGSVDPDEDDNNIGDNITVTTPGENNQQTNFIGVETNGTLGDVNWNITTDGILHITGGNLPAPDKSKISPWIKYASNIKSISFDKSTVGNADSSYLFAGLNNLQSIQNAKNFDTSNVTDMSAMFYNTGLNDLTEVGQLNVANVTKMDDTFSNTKVSDLSPIKDWNVSKLQSAVGMFSGSSITSASPLKNWDTSSLQNTMEMFSNTNLASLDGINTWKTDNLTDISAMFYGTKINSLAGLQNWKTSKVTGMAGTFAGTDISDLKPLSNWDTRSVINTSNMFVHTNIADTTPIANWKMSNVSDMYGMLSNTKLKSVSNLNWDLSKVEDISGLLSDNNNLEKVDLSSIQTAGNLTDISEMFRNDPLLTSVDISSLNTKNVITSDDVFTNSNSLKKINFGSNFVLPNSAIDIPTHGIKKTSENAPVWIGTEAGQPNDGTIPDSEVNSTNKVKGTYNFKGTSKTNNVIIRSNIGEQTVKDVSGMVGETVSVKVPTVSGYKADQDIIHAIVNQDGSITPTPDTYVTYTRTSTSGNTGNNHNSNNTNNSNNNSYDNTDEHTNDSLNIFKENNLISTHFDHSYFTLFNLNDNKMTKSNTRSLAKGTDWRSDQYVVVNGDKYYRVSTNEWINADSVYVYVPNKRVVTVTDKYDAGLLNASGKRVTNRGLAKGSSWRSDRIATLNGSTYFRVATNEFLSINDIDQ